VDYLNVVWKKKPNPTTTTSVFATTEKGGPYQKIAQSDRGGVGGLTANRSPHPPRQKAKRGGWEGVKKNEKFVRAVGGLKKIATRGLPHPKKLHS